MADNNSSPESGGDNSSKNMLTWFVFGIFILLISVFVIKNASQDGEKKKTLNAFYQGLAKNEIEDVKILKDRVVWKDKATSSIFFTLHNGPDHASEIFKDLQIAGGQDKSLNYETIKPSILESFFSSPMPWLLLISILFFVYMLRQLKGGSGGVLSFGRSKAQEITPEKISKTFADVAGVDEAKEEVMQIVDFLKSPDKYIKIGARIPKGVLLEGLPGTGKTLLAKAIAGEAGVPFFSISGSDFIEMFVGVGASRVRDLFQQAREKSPCIIFIDEIDAIGKSRGADPGGGERESHQTLNAILVEMDGFTSEDQVVVLGATNRADVLDNALLRPGRFDRHVHVNLPDIKGREEILHVHSKPIKLEDDIDFNTLAKMTPGYSGAELENLINEAALIAVEGGRTSVTMNDMEESRDKTSWGKTRKSKMITAKTKRETAYHEAGHAILSILIEDANPLHKVTILPRGHSLGMTMFLPNASQEDGVMTKRQIMAQICVSFGGRIAEELYCDDISTGASQDIEQATNLASKYVTQWGLSAELGPIKYVNEPRNYYDSKNLRNCSQRVSEQIDKEIKLIIDECYKKALDLIKAHSNEMQLMTDLLVEKEILSVEEICKVTNLNLHDKFIAGSDEEDKAKNEVKAESSKEETSDDASSEQKTSDLS